MREPRLPVQPVLIIWVLTFFSFTYLPITQYRYGLTVTANVTGPPVVVIGLESHNTWGMEVEKNHTQLTLIINGIAMSVLVVLTGNNNYKTEVDIPLCICVLKFFTPKHLYILIYIYIIVHYKCTVIIALCYDLYFSVFICISWFKFLYCTWACVCWILCGKWSCYVIMDSIIMWYLLLLDCNAKYISVTNAHAGSLFANPYFYTYHVF